MIFSIVSLLCKIKKNKKNRRCKKEWKENKDVDRTEGSTRKSKINAKLKKPCDAVTRKRLKNKRNIIY